MNRLAVLVRNDVRVQYRHGIYAAYGAVVVLYALVLATLGPAFPGWAVALLVYSDPSALGFFFLGGLMLLEKGDGVRNALAVTPVSARDYLAAKTLTLTALAVIAVTCLGLAHGNVANWPLLLAATSLTSVFFIGLGAGFALRFRTVNGYMLGSAALLAPTIGPSFLALIDPMPIALGLLPGVAPFRLVLTALGHGSDTVWETLAHFLFAALYAAPTLFFAERLLRGVLGAK